MIELTFLRAIADQFTFTTDLRDWASADVADLPEDRFWILTRKIAINYSRQLVLLNLS
jgi:hypothetical protein